jgi:hypothetical protein
MAIESISRSAISGLPLLLQWPMQFHRGRARPPQKGSAPSSPPAASPRPNGNADAVWSANAYIDACVMIRPSPRAIEALASLKLAISSERSTSRSSQRRSASVTASSGRSMRPDECFLFRGKGYLHNNLSIRVPTDCSTFAAVNFGVVFRSRAPLWRSHLTPVQSGQCERTSIVIPGAECSDPFDRYSDSAVIPVKAGTQGWVPAFAGMTGGLEPSQPGIRRRGFPCHCERSEAIPIPVSHCHGDCRVALLAMTGKPGLVYCFARVTICVGLTNRSAISSHTSVVTIYTTAIASIDCPGRTPAANTA